MTRVKRGSVAKQRRRKIFKITKGFQGSQSKLFRTANQQALKAMKYSYFDRKKKKRFIKSIWIRRINAVSRIKGLSYNIFINKLKANNILLNKKILSEIIINDYKTIATLLNKI